MLLIKRGSLLIFFLFALLEIPLVALIMVLSRVIEEVVLGLLKRSDVRLFCISIGHQEVFILFHFRVIYYDIRTI